MSNAMKLAKEFAGKCGYTFDEADDWLGIPEDKRETAIFVSTFDIDDVYPDHIPIPKGVPSIQFSYFSDPYPINGVILFGEKTVGYGNNCGKNARRYFKRLPGLKLSDDPLIWETAYCPDEYSVSRISDINDYLTKVTSYFDAEFAKQRERLATPFYPKPGKPSRFPAVREMHT